MTVELSSLKIGKACCCKNFFYLKSFSNDLKLFEPKKSNYFFNSDKYYCLFLYTRNNFLLRGVHTEVQIAKFVHYHHIHKNKERFLTGKKGKSFLSFMTVLSFKEVESTYGKKEPCKRSCRQIINFSHCLNFAYPKYGIIFF